MGHKHENVHYIVGNSNQEIERDVFVHLTSSFYSMPGSVLMIEVITKAVKIMMFPKKWIEEVEKES